MILALCGGGTGCGEDRRAISNQQLLSTIITTRSSIVVAFLFSGRRNGRTELPVGLTIITWITICWSYTYCNNAVGKDRWCRNFIVLTPAAIRFNSILTTDSRKKKREPNVGKALYNTASGPRVVLAGGYCIEPSQEEPSKLLYVVL